MRKQPVPIQKPRLRDWRVDEERFDAARARAVAAASVAEVAVSFTSMEVATALFFVSFFVVVAVVNAVFQRIISILETQQPSEDGGGIQSTSNDLQFMKDA